MDKEKYTRIFIILFAINLTCLLTSNIITIKTVRLIGLIFTVGDLLFPITYVLNDIFTEVYGFKKAKFIIYMSFFANLVMVILFYITIKLPSSSTFKYQLELEIIFGETPRVLIASFIAYVIGNLMNSFFLSKIKVITKGKYYALRLIISTIIGEGIDTLIFISIVFGGNTPFLVLLEMILSVFSLKVLLELLLIPITYKITKKIKEKENMDTYDSNEKYILI